MDAGIARADIAVFFFSDVLWERDFKNTCYRYDDVLSSAALLSCCMIDALRATRTGALVQ